MDTTQQELCKIIAVLLAKMDKQEIFLRDDDLLELWQKYPGHLLAITGSYGGMQVKLVPKTEPVGDAEMIVSLH